MTRGGRALRFFFVISLIFVLLVAFNLLHGVADPRDRLFEIGVLLAMSGYLVDCAFMLFYQKGIETNRPLAFATNIAILGGITIGAGSVVSSPRIISIAGTVLQSISAFLGPGFTIAVVATLACVGYALFWLKTNYLLTYAYGELVFALTTCYVATERAKHETGVGLVTAVAAAIYLVVRGLDNRRKALEEGQTARVSTRAQKRRRSIGASPPPIAP
jgi:hypothetical protein